MSKLSDFTKFDKLDVDSASAMTRTVQTVTWDQTLEDVTILIPAPKGKRAKDFIVDIQPSRLKISLKGHDRLFMDEALFSTVDKTESSWYLDESDSKLNIFLVKAHRGETWKAATYQGDESLIDPMTVDKMREKLMLERMQEDYPGFDFRDASFNGDIPDPRTFMR